MLQTEGTEEAIESLANAWGERLGEWFGVYVHVEEANLSGEGTEGEGASVGEAEAEESTGIEPVGGVEVEGLVGEEAGVVGIVLAGGEGGDPEEPPLESGEFAKVGRQGGPSLGSGVGDASGVDEEGAAMGGLPASNLDGFEAADEEGGPGLLQGECKVGHG